MGGVGMNYPKRRTLLASIATIPFVTTVRGTVPPAEIAITSQDGTVEYRTESTTTTTDSDDLKPAGTLHGPGSPVGIDGDYPSKMWWAPHDRYDNSDWIATATVGPSKDGDYGAVYWNRDYYWINDYVTFHERGHNLGFKHEDGGIMDNDPSDIESDTLHKTTQSIAKHADGLYVLDWSDGSLEMLRRCTEAWRSDYITTDDLRYIIDGWRDERKSGLEMYSDKCIERRIENKKAEYTAPIWSGGLYRESNSMYGEGTWAWK